MDFERYFFIVFMWQMYLIYLRKALILASGLGIFLGVSGRGGHFRAFVFLIAVLGQNHYKVGFFFWERVAVAVPQQNSVCALLTSRTEQNSPFSPSSFCRAQLSPEPSAPLPNPTVVRSSQAGAGAPCPSGTGRASWP